MVEKISFRINGKPTTVEVEPDMMVLDVLREVLKPHRYEARLRQFNLRYLHDRGERQSG